MARELSTMDAAECDGYSLTRYIKAVERLHGAIRFKFRPVTPVERARVIDNKRGLNEEATVMALAKGLTHRILTWDAKGRDGQVLPISIKSLTQDIHPEQLHRLMQIVIFCAEGGDPDPDSKSIDENEIPDLLAPNGGDGIVDIELKN